MGHLVVPMALRVTLGESGTEGPVDMFSAYQQFATDRSDKRLQEVEFGLRQEFRAGLADLRVDLADTKAEIIKWTLVMWIGQFAALAGVISYVTR